MLPVTLATNHPVPLVTSETYRTDEDIGEGFVQLSDKFRSVISGLEQVIKQGQESCYPISRKNKATRVIFIHFLI